MRTSHAFERPPADGPAATGTVSGALWTGPMDMSSKELRDALPTHGTGPPPPVATQHVAAARLAPDHAAQRTPGEGPEGARVNRYPKQITRRLGTLTRGVLGRRSVPPGHLVPRHSWHGPLRSDLRHACTRSFNRNGHESHFFTSTQSTFHSG